MNSQEDNPYQSPNSVSQSSRTESNQKLFPIWSTLLLIAGQTLPIFTLLILLILPALSRLREEVLVVTLQLSILLWSGGIVCIRTQASWKVVLWIRGLLFLIGVGIPCYVFAHIYLESF